MSLPTAPPPSTYRAFARATVFHYGASRVWLIPAVAAGLLLAFFVVATVPRFAAADGLARPLADRSPTLGALALLAWLPLTACLAWLLRILWEDKSTYWARYRLYREYRADGSFVFQVGLGTRVLISPRRLLPSPPVAAELMLLSFPGESHPALVARAQQLLASLPAHLPPEAALVGRLRRFPGESVGLDDAGNRYAAGYVGEQVLVTARGRVIGLAAPPRPAVSLPLPSRPLPPPPLPVQFVDSLLDRLVGCLLPLGLGLLLATPTLAVGFAGTSKVGLLSYGAVVLAATGVATWRYWRGMSTPLTLTPWGVSYGGLWGGQHHLPWGQIWACAVHRPQGARARSGRVAVLLRDGTQVTLPHPWLAVACPAAAATHYATLTAAHRTYS